MGRTRALLNLSILCAPIAIGLVMGLLVMSAIFEPISFGWFTLGLYLIGLALFLCAKWSLLRRGITISMGSSEASVWNRRAYRAGHTLMVFAIFATAALLEAVRLS